MTVKAKASKRVCLFVFPMFEDLIQCPFCKGRLECFEIKSRGLDDLRDRTDYIL